MNILLWVLQVLVAFVTASGAAWRFMNYTQASKDIPSVGALPAAAWGVINVFEIVCALGLVLPPLFKKGTITPIVAACLAVELLLVTGLHVRFFGFQVQATNPGVWSFSLAVLAAFIAYGRFVLKPF